jgi:hypothetical protein
MSVLGAAVVVEEKGSCPNAEGISRFFKATGQDVVGN